MNERPRVCLCKAHDCLWFKHISFHYILKMIKQCKMRQHRMISFVEDIHVQVHNYIGATSSGLAHIPMYVIKKLCRIDSEHDLK